MLISELPLPEPADPANAPRRPPAWRVWIPLAGSIGLISWLIWIVSPHKLLAALQQLQWPVVVGLTLVLVIAVCLWDSLCLKWLFSTGDQHLTYRAVVRARGTSYLFAIINYSFGQALLAWLLAEAKRITFLAAVGRCALIACADIWVLLSLGLVGSLLSSDPRVTGITRFCLVGLLLMIAISLAGRFLPAEWLERARRSRHGKLLAWPRWQWRHVVRLCAFRYGHIGLGVTYLSLALPLGGMEIAPIVVISVLPMVALVEGLPVSVAGIGSREAALLFFLQPDEPAQLLAFCLVWSASVV
jgi:hypothetical protein